MGNLSEGGWASFGVLVPGVSSGRELVEDPGRRSEKIIEKAIWITEGSLIFGV
jgi:hypothetical protein